MHHPHRTAFLLLFLSVGCAKVTSSSTAPLIETAASTVETPALRTGGQPSEEELRSWAEQGLTMVIDLRAFDESRGFDEVQILEELGISYFPLPISHGLDLSWNNAVVLDETISNSNGPVLIHCRSGNRVGALMALRFGLNSEVSTEAALEHGRQHGLTSSELEATVRDHLNDR